RTRPSRALHAFPTRRSSDLLTHFIPHALEHNFTQVQASSALGIMGAMNAVGTIGAGWLCDRVGRRGPLATYYILRGVSLFYLVRSEEHTSELQSRSDLVCRL